MPFGVMWSAEPVSSGPSVYSSFYFGWTQTNIVAAFYKYTLGRHIIDVYIAALTIIKAFGLFSSFDGYIVSVKSVPYLESRSLVLDIRLVSVVAPHSFFKPTIPPPVNCVKSWQNKSETMKRSKKMTTRQWQPLKQLNTRRWNCVHVSKHTRISINKYRRDATLLSNYIVSWGDTDYITLLSVSIYKDTYISFCSLSSLRKIYIFFSSKKKSCSARRTFTCHVLFEAYLKGLL